MRTVHGDMDTHSLITIMRLDMISYNIETNILISIFQSWVSFTININTFFARKKEISISAVNKNAIKNLYNN